VGSNDSFREMLFELHRYGLAISDEQWKTLPLKANHMNYMHLLW